MPDERESPSAGWREVFDEMAAETAIEESVHPCPVCECACENALRDVYECDEHGAFRASATDGSGPDTERGQSTDESDEVKQR